MIFDPYILAFSALTVLATVWMGFWSARRSKTAHDFFVAGRSVSVGWNASAISGEYLSAASFMGVAGMVMSSGYDALWYPVCYACGYLFLLLFIAGPLRRFGAYTIPDFAEGRFDSPLFRKIAVVFVLFIGFFYTMPQMKGAGTTLAYIFPGLPYWAGVVLVGAVITLNVALGGMKGITLVQAFQYWLKMFAISVPIFVLMAVHGHYGSHLQANLVKESPGMISEGDVSRSLEAAYNLGRKEPSSKAPADSTWLSPFGPLTTKPAKARLLVTTESPEFRAEFEEFSLNTRTLFEDVSAAWRVEKNFKNSAESAWSTAKGEITSGMKTMHFGQVMGSYNDATRQPVFWHRSVTNIWNREQKPFPGFRRTLNRQEYTRLLEDFLFTNGVALIHHGKSAIAVPASRLPQLKPAHEQKGLAGLLESFGASAVSNEKKAWLAKNEKPLALLYTYSLIIALVCGTAGLPHILVRFYTNPDGVAAKRTTLWVMILIGVFYLFPPVFGVMGRNLMPELYNGLSGVKGTDGVVLRLPTILSERLGTVGSILSGITCAGAFAAFMSTFSGLLVSITGALAHDIYGRILRPRSTPNERMWMFKLGAVICGVAAMLLGFLVEKFEINKMVGWAFAIAATSYFPLLFLSTWWRGMTMKGAAAGMLGGGSFSLIAIASTMFADQALWAEPLKHWYAAHPLWRILAEQPAIWALPLAIGLMMVISKLTRNEVPSDVRMKMLVLHAPEKLGLKQEYIQEHQHGP